MKNCLLCNCILIKNVISIEKFFLSCPENHFFYIEYSSNPLDYKLTIYPENDDKCIQYYNRDDTSYFSDGESFYDILPGKHLNFNKFNKLKGFL